MKKYIFPTFYFIPLFFSFCLSIDTVYALEWQELKGEHFIVYFTQDEKFAQEVLNKAEVYYRRIATDLGYPRYKEFWTWGQRVKIYVYPDHDSFLKASGQPQWSEGVADYKNRKIMSFMWSSGFFESLLPHEIAHLIFRDFVGFKGEIPLWLDEGVAQWAEEQKRNEIKKLIQDYFRKNKLVSLEDLMKTDIRYIRTDGAVYIRPTRTSSGDKGILFLSGEELIKLYYLQAVSLMSFLIETYGGNRFSDFCRQLRDGSALTDALRSAFSPYINDVQELEKRWKEYLEKGVF